MNPLTNQFSENGLAQKFPESSIIIKSTAQYLLTWCQGVVPKGVPPYFSPEVAFGAKFTYLLSGSGREMSVARSYVTDSFRPWYKVISK